MTLLGSFTVYVDDKILPGVISICVPDPLHPGEFIVFGQITNIGSSHDDNAPALSQKSEITGREPGEIKKRR